MKSFNYILLYQCFLLKKDGKVGEDHFLVLALGEGQQLGLETFHPTA